jgi:UDP-N-acetylmuramoyl-tripeptide--D-alanyl-D-alanine ligase
LFFALKGDRFDGNNFVGEALEKGAAFSVADRPGLPAHPQIISVPDALIALQQLAAMHRRVLNIPVVAVTGTNGKTTTKELLACVLAMRYTVGVTQGNRNNHIGVPLTLLQMNAATQIGIVEMGANHPGEIAALCRIAAPTAGLITNIGRAHLEGFGSLEGVQKTKGELYDFLAANGGSVFCHAGDAALTGMVAARRFKQIIYYGAEQDHAQLLQSDSRHPFLRLAVPGYPAIETQLVGAYNTGNILAALAAGRFFEVTKEDAAAAVNNYVPSNNRSQLIRTERNTVIMDAYNANPSSMRAAIEHFAQTGFANKWLILGDMLELGAESAKEHLAVLRLLDEKKFPNTLLAGRQFSQAGGSRYPCFDTVEALIDYLKAQPLSDATVLVKGSHSMGMERLGKFL